YSNIVPISGNQDEVKKKISDIRNKTQTFSGTEIAGAITSAVNEFGSTGGYDRNYIILLTDGMPSNYNAARENAAVEAAKKAGITIFTIGLGKYIDAGYLYDIAEETHGQFFQASNADALDNIYDKISSFMSYNQVTIEEETGRKGYIVADSGFNVVKDGLGYANFRSDFAPNGTDVGISGLIRAYYRGELAPTAVGYTTSEGKEIPGYDISTVEGFTDGRVDLKSVEIDILKAYNEYNARKDKWNYRSIEGGVLHYTSETRDFLDSVGLKVTTAPCSFEVPEESGFIQFIRTITFNKVHPFTQYECVLIDSSLCTGEDEKIMDMLRWYNSIPQNSSRCRVYDFGYQGDDAFDALFSELSTGSPAVITYGGSAMNAVRIIRDANEPDKYVLDAYDSNSPDRSTRINITRSPIYNEDGTTSFQYTASRGTEEEPLRIIVMN
ncbi:MAG: VWA domain-containing protein, partial [Oscillospiraceae bacterium]|nr:VWA domain-containing protein [Oscillospiraceae bacterium]